MGEKRTEVVNSMMPTFFWCVHCRQWTSLRENPNSWHERIKWATFFYTSIHRTCKSSPYRARTLRLLNPRGVLAAAPHPPQLTHSAAA